ncbi:MAG: autotransporter outer membrane beta-barrel domain-containing protein [Pseudomonadota bacterium]|nr:autotransporter outer membrane beta-barrel domain-containing protein [Pseudomonadota bacterium]
MRNAISRLLTVALLSGATGLLVLGHPAEVRAQSVFCPPNGSFGPNNSGNTAISLQNGACTNGKNGAFSGAALASQALSELTETTTQETTKNTIDAVTNRRAQEEQRCAEGFTRVDGTCQPIPRPVSHAAAPAVPLAPAPSLSEVREPRGKKTNLAARRRHRLAAPAEVVRRGPAPPPPSMLMPVPIVPAILPLFPSEPGVRYATWAQVYGDYEKRNATGFVDVLVTNVANVDVQSRTGTVGFLAGADLTSRGVIFANDGLIAGVLAGYVSSDLTLNTSSFGSTLGHGSSRTNANVSGPTAGLYATYFNGGFSTDFTLRVDAQNVDETFKGADACSCGPPPFPVSGHGSVPLLNATVAGNLNYRFNVYPNFWIEPTVGAQYTNSSYGLGAAQLGLDDGNLVMVQGGARFGTSTLIDNHILMTTTLTGLAYDDVLVAGGFIQAAAFEGQNLLVQADRGQVRGRGILAFNFDFGQGISTYVLGEARGGKGLFGAGGKAGVRVQW